MIAVLLILIAFYLDSKSETKSTFINDLKGGLFVFAAFIIYAVILRYMLNINIIIIIFSIGIELILLFVLKAYLTKKRSNKS